VNEWLKNGTQRRCTQCRSGLTMNPLGEADLEKRREGISDRRDSKILVG
jgi:hypothetical protein